jgi:hypothetical protein
MLAEVQEESLVLLQGGVQPGKIDCADVLICGDFPSFRHGERVSVENDRIRSLGV